MMFYGEVTVYYTEHKFPACFVSIYAYELNQKMSVWAAPPLAAGAWAFPLYGLGGGLRRGR